MELSDISDDDKHDLGLYVIKLEHELDRARLNYQINESIWSEKEGSLNSIIAEQKQVISLLESLLKSNQQYYADLQENTTRKDESLLALNDDISKTLASTADQIEILTKNVTKAEQALERKDHLLSDYESKLDLLTKENASLQQALTKHQEAMQATLAEFDTIKQEAMVVAEDLQSRVRELTQQRDAFKRGRDSAQSEVEDLKQKDILAQKYYASLQQKWDIQSTEALTHKVALERKVADISRLYQTSKDESEELQERFNEIENLYNWEKKQRQQAQHSTVELVSRLGVVQGDKERLQETIENERRALSSEAIHSKERLTELEKRLVEEQQQLIEVKAEHKALEEKFRRAEVNLAGLFAREQKYKKNISVLEESVVAEKEKIYETISYQLGHATLQAGKSFSGLLRLPTTLLTIRKEARARKLKKNNSKKIILEAKPFVPAVVEKRDTSIADSLQVVSAVAQVKNLRIASIMDEFTYRSYEPEAEILQLHFEHWNAQLLDFKPDLVFIESAWNGVEGCWKGKISNADPEIIKIIDWCRENAVPSLFWNKEDPVHFATFLPVASRVDVIFTTDVDCLPKYKRAVGHNRVYLLPFAAQPLSHNPIEKYSRKDAFNFAGSYYLRYPERQRDFAALVDTVRKIRPFEIYDRNFENPHPHYIFPEKYRDYILGALPFEQIDKAYKGYRYGINMNTIKQSQTMFARRVFELLASNTVVVSNFSRGVRLMFGDLVVSSDNSQEIQKRLEAICQDETVYRKFRLLGLRKVMKEHTYSARLNFISEKLLGSQTAELFPEVVIIARVFSRQDIEAYLENRKRQSYPNVRGLIVSSSTLEHQLPERDLFVTPKGLEAYLNGLLANSYVLFFSNEDYYGKNYVQDLALARRYTAASVVGKATFYYENQDVISLCDDGSQYSMAKQLSARCSMSHRSVMTNDLIFAVLDDINDYTLALPSMLSLDEFNYCRNVQGWQEEKISAIVDDLICFNQGMVLSQDISEIAAEIKPSERIESTNSLPHIVAADLFKTVSKSGSNEIQWGMRKLGFYINSRLPVDKHVYLYSKKIYSRPEMNMVLNSQFKLECETTCELKTVFEFQDAAGNKIAHSMTRAGGFNSLAIPENCVKLRFGLRIQGPGDAKITKLILGNYSPKPVAVVSTSPYLVLTKQYPDYDDLYKYGFLHTRVRAYREHGLSVDVFRMTEQEGNTYREFEDVDIVSGGAALLDATLSTGQYKNVLVHLLDSKMWAVLEKHLDKVRVTVWAHGAEIQVWQRRQFEFDRLSLDEIQRQKKLSDKRVKFWRSILKNPHPNLRVIFVSKYFANEVADDFDIDLSKIQYDIVHNYIDEKIFPYVEKTSEDRKRLLSIRPYASKKYANDLTVKAVLELSKRDFFYDLEFAFYGDGDLFEQTTQALMKFENVKLHRKFLSHREIADLHKQYGIFLTPTRMDSQGVSRDEAMSSGLVPITTNVTAIPEFVDQTCGVLVEGEDYIAMANAVEDLYRSPEKFLALSRNAHKRVRQQSGVEETILKEIRIIEQDNVKG